MLTTASGGVGIVPISIILPNPIFEFGETPAQEVHARTLPIAPIALKVNQVIFLLGFTFD